jgi:hypothetical protein
LSLRRSSASTPILTASSVCSAFEIFDAQTAGAVPPARTIATRTLPNDHAAVRQTLQVLVGSGQLRTHRRGGFGGRCPAIFRKWSHTAV